MGSSLLTGTNFTPGSVEWCIVEAVWHSETRGPKDGNSEHTHGTEGVVIGVVLVSNLARIDACRGASSGSIDVNEARLDGNILPVPNRDGLGIFIS